MKKELVKIKGKGYKKRLVKYSLCTGCSLWDDIEKCIAINRRISCSDYKHDHNYIFIEASMTFKVKIL